MLALRSWEAGWGLSTLGGIPERDFTDLLSGKPFRGPARRACPISSRLFMFRLRACTLVTHD
jgi:hypothetical protein